MEISTRYLVPGFDNVPVLLLFFFQVGLGSHQSSLQLVELRI